MNSAPNAPPAYEDVATLRHENFYYSPTPPYALPEFIQAPPQNIIIVNSPAPQSRDPTRMRCPNCLDEIETRIESRATTQTHVIALLLCLFVCWPCAPFVYCCDNCMAAEHYCPKCNTMIGRFNG